MATRKSSDHHNAKLPPRMTVTPAINHRATAADPFIDVSGTAQDAIGLPYANGTIVATLNISGSPTLNGLPYTPPQQPVGLDANGRFSFNLAANSVLLPSGSSWSFTICSAQGTVPISWGRQSVCFQVTNLTLNGSQDITGAIISKAEPLTYSASFLATAGETRPLLFGLVDFDFDDLDASGRATVEASALGSQDAVGFAVFVPGGQGIVQVATGLVVPAVTDNQSTVGNWVTASSSVRGECHDYGASFMPVLATYGQVIRANDGPHTISMIYISPFLSRGGGGGQAPGTVTLVTAGDLISNSPSNGSTIFSTTVTNSTSTPAINFALNPSIPASSLFGQPLAGLRQPGFFTLDTTTDVTLAGSGNTGSLKILALRFGGAPNSTTGTRIPMSATPPAAGQVLAYNGTNIVGMDLPTGGGAQIVASGTATFPAATIPANGAGDTVIVSAPGINASDVVSWVYANANAVLNGYLQVVVVMWLAPPNSIHMSVSNPSPNALTIGAATINWKVIR